MLFQTFDTTTRWDIWILPLDGARAPTPVLQTPFDERDARYSPDGEWIAYSSDESGREEIYVRKVHGPTVKVPISATGGVQPAWRQDSRELFYLALDGRLMAVPLQASGGALVAGAPAPLFTTHVGSMVASLTRQNYAVSADGARFLMNTMADDPNQAPITVVVNWSGMR